VIGLSNGRAAGHYLIHAVETWIYYLALEPYVRRVWPRMLIGLMRVFSGHWRDPVIGREVLIGVTTGCVLAAVVYIVAAADSRVTGGEAAHLAHPTALRMLLSPGHYLTGQAQHVAWAVLSGVCWAGVVVLIRLIVRHVVVSAALSIAVIGLMDAQLYSVVAIDSQLARLVFAVGIGGCLVWLYTRIGVLAAFFFYFIVLSMGLFGFTFDAWSTPYLLVWLATLAALAAYGFWVSLGGQPGFKDLIADPEMAD
jgi:serine/threonine-protein kinase